MKIPFRQEIRRFQIRLFGKNPVKVPHFWMSSPPNCTKKKMCLFVTYAPNGVMTYHAKYHFESWIKAGFHCVLIYCVDDTKQALPPKFSEDSVFILVRKNEGYDFSAWATAISLLPSLKAADFLFTVNDSMFGPTAYFPDFIERMLNADADYVGAIESREVKQHYQSFLLGFSGRMLSSKTFWSFWRGVRVGGRDFVITHYEIRMLEVMARSGLTCKVMLPSEGPGVNRTLGDWRGLLNEGFPYIKVQLVRDNPHDTDIEGWQDELSARGYDPALASIYLAGLRE